MEYNREIPRLIPDRANLKHLDASEDECRIAFLFGTQFEPVTRALVAEIEQLNSSKNDPVRLSVAKAELEARRWELFCAVEHCLNSNSVGRADIALPNGEKKPGYQAIGQWIAELPPAVLPPMSAALLSQLGLKTDVKTVAATAYQNLMGAKYKLPDLSVTTFNGIGASAKKEYEAWVRSLTVELDNEPGDDPDKGTWLWVLENNSRFKSNDPYATFIFRDSANGQIVATASFVEDDRGVAAQLGLDKVSEFLGIWGFFQVRRELRCRGLGSVISHYVDDHVQAYVNGIGAPKYVYLFTGVPHAMKIYERLGFKRQDGSVNLPEFGFEEVLYKKTYRPLS